MPASSVYRKSLALIGLVALLLLGGSGARAQNAERVEQLLKGTGYTYKKASDKVWTLSFQGKAAPSWGVYVATDGKGLVVIGTVVAHKAEMDLTQPLLTKLLHYNDEFDRVKVALDDDGDLALRIDVSERVLDSSELQVDLE